MAVLPFATTAPLIGALGVSQSREKKKKKTLKKNPSMSRVSQNRGDSDQNPQNAVYDPGLHCRHA